MIRMGVVVTIVISGAFRTNSRLSYISRKQTPKLWLDTLSHIALARKHAQSRRMAIFAKFSSLWAREDNGPAICRRYKLRGSHHRITPLFESWREPSSIKSSMWVKPVLILVGASLPVLPVGAASKWTILNSVLAVGLLVYVLHLII